MKTLRGNLLPSCVFVTACFGAVGLAAGATLFDSMGGDVALHTAVDRFADIVEADDRINFTFAETDNPKFKALLYEQLCEISGGPCHYGGRDMRTAHAKLNITTAEFNALPEDGRYFGLESRRKSNHVVAGVRGGDREGNVIGGQAERLDYAKIINAVVGIDRRRDLSLEFFQIGGARSRCVHGRWWVDG